jgi:hypothetical protein
MMQARILLIAAAFAFVPVCPPCADKQPLSGTAPAGERNFAASLEEDTYQWTSMNLLSKQNRESCPAGT